MNEDLKDQITLEVFNYLDFAITKNGPEASISGIKAVISFLAKMTAFSKNPERFVKLMSEEILKISDYYNLERMNKR